MFRSNIARHPNSTIILTAFLAAMGTAVGCASGGHAEHVRTDPGYGGELRLEYGVLSKRAAYAEAENLMAANCGGRGHRITSEDTVRAVRPGAEKRAEQAMRYGDVVAYQDATRLEFRVCYDCLPYHNEIGSPQDPKSNVSVLSSIRNGERINADDAPAEDDAASDHSLNDVSAPPRRVPKLAPVDLPERDDELIDEGSESYDEVRRPTERPDSSQRTRAVEPMAGKRTGFRQRAIRRREAPEN